MTEGVRIAGELLKRIPRTGQVTARELCKELEDAGIKRDVRSIQRLMATLSKVFDITYDSGSKPYGYRWRTNSPVLSVSGLTPQESVIFELVRGHLKNLMPANLLSSMAPFFEEARRNLRAPGDEKKLDQQWLRKVRIVRESQPLIAPSVEPEILNGVTSALYRNHWLEIDYRNARGSQTCDRVMPLGLAQQGPRLYLICRFNGYDNERALALHRLKSAQVTTLTFERPDDFDFDKYDSDGRFGFGYGERIQLKLRIDKIVGAYLLESPLSDDQQVTELPGSYEITATVVESSQLVWWLMHFGARARVLAPASLVEQVRQEHAAAAAAYEAGSNAL